MLSVELKIKGFEPARDAVEQMAHRSLVWSIPHSKASTVLLENMRQQFTALSPPVKSNFRDFRTGLSPFRDTGELYRSLTSHFTQSYASAGTTHVRGVLDRDTPYRISVKANKGYAAIPLCPPLTTSEAHLYNNVRVPGGFVLWEGPEGPGVYRKATHRVKTLVLKRGVLDSGVRTQKTIERVKAFVRPGLHPARSFAKPPDGLIEDLGERYLHYFYTGKFEQHWARKS